jgi:hypothetical protein
MPTSVQLTEQLLERFGAQAPATPDAIWLTPPATRVSLRRGSAAGKHVPLQTIGSARSMNERSVVGNPCQHRCPLLASNAKSPSRAPTNTRPSRASSHRALSALCNAWGCRHWPSRISRRSIARRINRCHPGPGYHSRSYRPPLVAEKLEPSPYGDAAHLPAILGLHQSEAPLDDKCHVKVLTLLTTQSTPQLLH